MHKYMSLSLYSHCYTPTCFNSQGAVLSEFWYVSWAGSAKYVPRCKYQVDEQRVIRLMSSVLFVRWQLSNWIWVVFWSPDYKGWVGFGLIGECDSLCVFLVPDLHIPYVNRDIVSGLSLENFLCWPNHWSLLRHFMCITQACTNFWIFFCPKPVSGVFQHAEHYCLLWTVIYRHMCNLLIVCCSRDRSLGDASP